MRTRPVASALCGAALLLGLTACGDGDSEPDTSACREAITRDYESAMASGTDIQDSVRPAPCDEVGDKTLQKIIKEVAAEHREHS
ncbi:hypothetical protein [Streptomyces sp. NPDC014894]|uniref:hypothetical protein n=1 Tax=Streptomyces sp. NPDC014894 TaxID=3364931 RepID=UPI0036F839EF